MFGIENYKTIAVSNFQGSVLFLAESRLFARCYTKHECSGSLFRNQQNRPAYTNKKLQI